MSDRQLGTRHIGLCGPRLFIFFGVLLLSSCAAAPFLIPAGIEFARNLLVTSNKNYGGKYSADMNQLVMRLSTPYVGMGLPPGTPPSALIPPAMQQQQAMMGQQPGQMPGQPGQGMPGQAPDPYAQMGMTNILPNTGPVQQPGYGGMQSQPYGYQGQPGAYDPNNPYMPPPTNIQAPVYGMQQYGGQYGGQYGTQYGQAGVQAYGQMGGLPQSGYPPQQGLPLQPGYPAMAPGNVAQTPGYPQQTMPGYQQPSMDPYQQPVMAGIQGYQQQPMPGMQPYQQQAMSGYQQQMMPGYQQQAMPGMQPYPQQMMPGYQQQPIAGQSYGYQGQVPNMGVGYPGQIYPRSVSADPVALDVALVRQVSSANGKQVTLLHDGETLKGGPDGDRFKLIVRTNCECFLYIISVDGSGWAQPVFPLPNGSVSNPLKPEMEQAFPEGQYWFTLDQYKGVETFFLVASPARRTDLEESLAQLAGQQRPATKAEARVEEPAVIPNGFGKTQSGHTTSLGDKTQPEVQVTALSYVASKPGEDVRITRWFNHQ